MNNILLLIFPILGVVGALRFWRRPFYRLFCISAGIGTLLLLAWGTLIIAHRPAYGLAPIGPGDSFESYKDGANAMFTVLAAPIFYLTVAVFLLSLAVVLDGFRMRNILKTKDSQDD